MAHSQRYDVSSTRLPGEKENREENIATRVKSRKRLSSEGVPGDVEDAKLSTPTTDVQDSKQVTQLPQKKESVRKKSKPSESCSPENIHRIAVNQDEKCTGPSAIARSEEQLLEMISSIKELAKYGEKEVGKKADKKKSFIQKLKNTSRNEII